MKKFAKLIGLMLAFIVVVSAVVLPTSASGEGYLTYTEYSSYAKLTKCLSGARGVINIPSTFNGLPVKVIGNGAFADCSLITEVTIPSSVTTVEQNAFSGCTALEKVTFAGSTCNIGNAAFTHCSSIKTIKLPSALEEIPAEMLAYNTSLTSIAIPSTVKSIGKEAFKMCSDLTYVGIPASVKVIGTNAFLGCSSVDEYYVSPDNSVYSSSNDCLYGPYESPYDSDVTNPITDKTFIQYPNAKTSTSYTVDAGTLRIADYAFGDNQYLTKIVLPSGLKAIDNFAFYNCTKLSDISIPSTVSAIGSQAFGKTTSLKSITVPGTVESLESVFYASGVETVVLKNGVKTIGTRCFEDCDNLRSVSIPSSVTKIGIGAFYYCTSLESLLVPSSVTSFGSSAFAGCNKLTLRVYANSKALEYAQKNSIPYVIVDPTYVPTIGVEEITVYEYPAKTNYRYKENVDTSGMVLLVVYEDGSTELIDKGYSVSPSKLTSTGSVKVEVNYGGCSTYFNVEVSYAWWQWIIRILLLGFLWY